MGRKVNREQQIERTGEEKINNQGCLMKIVKYINYRNIDIKFFVPQETIVRARYDQFVRGCILNPYYPVVFNKGYTGNKYPIANGKQSIKEYKLWIQVLRRTCSEEYKKRFPAYKDVTICNEWLNFENFYEWLHSQENFEKWLNGKRWAIDKDILLKGNKIYSPDTCCLVPQYINNLFMRKENDRGEFPIGVSWNKDNSAFSATCSYNGSKFLGYFNSPDEAFNVYKFYKEKLIKEKAQEAFNNNDINEKCYRAMLRYQVEITD